MTKSWEAFDVMIFSELLFVAKESSIINCIDNCLKAAVCSLR
jgi:hypothetical protein